MDHFNEKNCNYQEPNAGDVSCDGWRMAMRIEGAISMILILLASTVIRAPRDGEAVHNSRESSAPPDPISRDQSGGIPPQGRRTMWFDKSMEHLPVECGEHDSASNATREETAGNRLGVGGDATDVMDEDLNNQSSEENAGVLVHSADLPQISLTEVLRTRTFLMLLMFKFSFAFAYLNLFGHVAAFATDAGIPADTASVALSSIGISSVAGRLSLGYLADRFGRVVMLRASMIVLMACAAAWQFCDNAASLFTLCIIFGFNAGGYPSLPPSIIADYFGKLSPANLFKMVGLVFTIETPGILFGIPLVGLMFDRTGSYRVGSIFTASMMLLGNVFLWLIPSQQSQHDYITRRFSQRTAAAVLGSPTIQRKSTCLGTCLQADEHRRNFALAALHSPLSAR